MTDRLAALLFSCLEKRSCLEIRLTFIACLSWDRWEIYSFPEMSLPVGDLLTLAMGVMTP